MLRISYSRRNTSDLTLSKACSVLMVLNSCSSFCLYLSLDLTWYVISFFILWFMILSATQSCFWNAANTAHIWFCHHAVEVWAIRNFCHNANEQKKTSNKSEGPKPVWKICTCKTTECMFLLMCCDYTVTGYLFHVVLLAHCVNFNKNGKHFM